MSPENSHEFCSHNCLLYLVQLLIKCDHACTTAKVECTLSSWVTPCLLSAISKCKGEMIGFVFNFFKLKKQKMQNCLKEQTQKWHLCSTFVNFWNVFVYILFIFSPSPNSSQMPTHYTLNFMFSLFFLKKKRKTNKIETGKSTPTHTGIIKIRQTKSTKLLEANFSSLACLNCKQLPG